MDARLAVALVFLGVTVMSWIFVDVSRMLAVRWQAVSHPNERSSHLRPIPVGGGVSIVLINIAAWVYVGFIQHGMSAQHALAFLIAAALLSAASLLDDLRDISYRVRLAVHSAVALIFIFGNGYFVNINIPVFATISLGGLGILLTFVWIVGMVNAYNFMDGIDGMAGGQAVAAGIGWILLGGFTHHRLVMGLGIIVAASSLGFLLHNWHPATIFMGDLGATFLGFTLAVLPIMAARSDPRLALAGGLLVWPSVFDSGYTVLRRLKMGENIFVGHRTFLFHRLIHAGWSHSAAATLYIPLPILGALLAITWTYGNPVVHVFVATSVVWFCAGLVVLVRHQERKLPVILTPQVGHLMALQDDDGL